MTTIKIIQRALVDAGFPVGKAGVDGIWGRDSIAALKQFQGARGLIVTGVADEKTLAVLLKTSTLKAPVPWYEEAGRLMGLAEIVGPKHNPTILGWAKEQWAKAKGVAYTDDETPWCGLFVGHCIGVTLPAEPMPANPLGARNWLNFGVPLTTPTPGAVAVFSRPGSSWSGHVGFYVGERKSDGALRIRGGNQSNRVSEIWMAKDRLLGLRWPKTVQVPQLNRIYLTASGAVSANEA